MIDFLTNITLEIFYTLYGLVCPDAGWRAFRENDKAKYGTTLFWVLVDVTFILGKWIPSMITGGILVVMGTLTVSGQVRIGTSWGVSVEEKEKGNRRIKSWIFLPAATVGLMALAMSLVRIDGAALDGAATVGTACLVSFVLAVIICRPKINEACENTTKWLMQVGASRLLPQLLGVLGTLFTEAGVDDVISTMIPSVVSSGNTLIGVTVYCLGMIIFTMIMENASAVFSVITLGIGIPFVTAQGGNPVAVGALGMTCGFCGTLLTSTAANFDIVSTAVLETRNKWTIIRAQASTAFAMIVVHIVLTLLLAFQERKLFMKVLVTGFDPFGREPINPAIESVKLLPATIEGAEIIKLEILTAVHKSLQVTREAIQERDPDMIPPIGQTGGRSDLTVERTGINIDDCRITDNEGNQPADKPVFADGDAAYFSNLPIKATVNEVRRNKIPASILDNAGTFICNHVPYGVRYMIEKEFVGKRSGFIHIPYLPQRMVDRPGQPNMALEVIVKGLTCAISVMIHNEVDVKTTGGTICQNETACLWIPANGVV